MNQKTPWLCVTLLVLLAAAQARAAGELTITLDKPNALYAVGEPIHWKVQWNGSAPPSAITYDLKKNDFTDVSQGTLTLDKNAAALDGKLDEPGWLLLKVTATSADGEKFNAISGALADPQKLQPTSPRPTDFDEFWNSKLQELAAIPPNPKLEAAASTKPDIDYFKITMDNIRGSHIQGQLARPSKGDKFPALLILQWAGVYPLDKSWVVDKAAEGWLALDINAHDLPIDQPKSFYQQNAALKNYPTIGNDDRDTSYFLRMYLADYRALEFLKSRPDWNGKTLVVMGTSMGGQQSLMLAGLHPDDITAVMVDVPSGSDMLGPAAGRLASYPSWYWNTAGKDAAKVHEASRYFDVTNFVSHIKCPVLAGIGMIDETSPPTSVMTSMNQIQSPKEIILMPGVPHQETHNTHIHYYQRAAAWRMALLKDDPPPVNRE